MPNLVQENKPSFSSVDAHSPKDGFLQETTVDANDKSPDRSQSSASLSTNSAFSTTSELHLTSEDYASIGSKVSTHRRNRSRTHSRTPGGRTTIFRRSNSISIPTAKSLFDVEDLSKSCSAAYSRMDNSKYGSMDHASNDSNNIHPDLSNNSISSNSGVDDVTCIDEQIGPSEKLYFGFTRKQLKVFISLVLLSVNDIMGYSAIATFFPIVAASKGLTSTQIGFIFASYSICGILASIIVGIVLVKVGAKFCVIAGMFWNTGAIICFGFLDSSAKLPFFILCIVSRGLMGFGSSTAFTAMFAIIFQEFSQRAITVMSISEALVGVGGMIAPLIGGGLYDAGGYITPFMVLGGAQILLLILCWYMLPYVPIQKEVTSKPPFYLLIHSSAFIATLVVVFVFAANSFLTANIAEFLKDQFNMDAVMVGITLLVSSVFYAGMSPLWGYIADRWKKSFIMEISTVGVSIAMAIIGPVIFLRHLFGWNKQKLWLMYLAAVLNGAFFGGALMPTFNEMLLGAKELKMSESELAQYGLVSGLWNMAFSVGDILGPTVGGILVENFGFENSAGIFALTGFFLAFCKLTQRYIRHRTRNTEDEETSENDDETKPLLAGDCSIQA
ncbi:MFS-type transporter SLC18B1-like [Clavelina lepadiformis]|uniref:MFS-type transporter SLC18B1-like n=1 Tax=Clavelina lepadiformis TaxID=159417 RepID=UPI0040437536